MGKEGDWVNQANNFCPAPWFGMYYHSNSVSPCCTMQTREVSLEDYFESDWLYSLKKDLLENKKPTDCNSCWDKESKGLKSTRDRFLKKFRESDYATAKIEHLEVRESNLCNLMCRMCNPNDSIKIERELEQHPELKPYYYPSSKQTMSEENWANILKISEGVTSLSLTGGEPLLIKRYYDLLDHLSVVNPNVLLKVYTNCTVYNPIFVEKLLKFRDVEINMSIDAVGEVAEYQRHGVSWDIVRKNIFQFMKLPINTKIRSTVSAYSILDVSRFADFLLEIKDNPERRIDSLSFTAHTVRAPAALTVNNLNADLRVRAISQIDEATRKLSDKLFLSYNRELNSIRKQLVQDSRCNYHQFVALTKSLDKARNQSFEKVFGYSI
jgi:organic radical activating enzyme